MLFIQCNDKAKVEDEMSLDSHLTSMSQLVGYHTLSPAAGLAPDREVLPTGMRAVDELLDGGFVAGGTHCISGEPTSGASSLLYQAVASAQAQGVPVLYLDMAGRFDRHRAASAGVDLERLPLHSETSLEKALLLIRGQMRRGLPGLLVFDHPAPLPLARLRASLRDAPLTLLALSQGSLPGMQVSLECLRQEWRMERGTAVGFISEVRLTAHPFLPYRQVRACFDVSRGEACSARR